MNRLVFLAFAFTAASACAAQVDRVIVRQQWPWHEGIQVEYVLSGMSGPVDIGVSVTRDGLSVPVPNAALKGDLHGVRDAVGSFTIDPAVLFGGENVKADSLRVALTASDSPANIDEVLYKIFDLSSGECEDVTRAQILNGEKGSYETDYSKISPGFSTPLTDVLIWTGVTNNIAYKTTHLVMRKISAADKVWQSGDPAGVTYANRDPFDRYWVKLTYDYYVAVFEMTQAQYKNINDGSLYGTECKYTDDEESPCYPVNGTGRYNVLGHPTRTSADDKGVVSGANIIFPHNSYVRDVAKNSFLAKMWSKTGVEFNLPTGAEWEFACRGGNDTPLYSGEAQTEGNVSKIAWHKGISGATAAERKPAVVGSLAPNAYGVYDMLGNVFEQTTMSGNFSEGAESGTGASSDDPAVNPIGSRETTATSSYSSAGTSFYQDPNTHEYYGAWQDCRSAVRSDYFDWSAQLKYVGFRVVMPARADGQWADHPAE